MTTPLNPQSDFNEITQLIHAARQSAVQAEWDDGVVAQLAEHLACTQPGLRGFTSRNLFRMRQFYEAYQGDEIVSPLVRQLPWSHNCIILDFGKVSPLVSLIGQ